uniref:Tick transposon n=1 Tax=Toxocara canis TaxID=6265 RepID=A0A183VFA8_TOXCA
LLPPNASLTAAVAASRKREHDLDDVKPDVYGKVQRVRCQNIVPRRRCFVNESVVYCCSAMLTCADVFLRLNDDREPVLFLVTPAWVFS